MVGVGEVGRGGCSGCVGWVAYEKHWSIEGTGRYAHNVVVQT